jgi:hypothetical protein
MQTEPQKVKSRDVRYWRLSCPFKHEREWDGDSAYGNLAAAASWAGSTVTVGSRRQFQVGITDADGYTIYAGDGDYIVEAAGQFVVMSGTVFAAAFG